MEYLLKAVIIEEGTTEHSNIFGVMICSYAEFVAVRLKGQTQEEFHEQPWWWVINNTVYWNTSIGVWVKRSDMSWRKG